MTLEIGYFGVVVAIFGLWLIASAVREQRSLRALERRKAAQRQARRRKQAAGAEHRLTAGEQPGTLRCERCDGGE